MRDIRRYRSDIRESLIRYSTVTIWKTTDLSKSTLSWKSAFESNESRSFIRYSFALGETKKEIRISEGKRDGREEGESEKSDIRNKAKLIFCLAQPLRVVVRGETGVFQAN